MQKKHDEALEPLCLFQYTEREGRNGQANDDDNNTYKASTRTPAASRTKKCLKTSHKRQTGKPALKLSPLVNRHEMTSSDETDERNGAFRDRTISKRGPRGRSRKNNWRQHGKPKKGKQEPPRHLTSYFLAAGKLDDSTVPENIPTLTEVLDTIKDAWPNSKQLDITRPLEDDNLNYPNKGEMDKKLIKLKKIDSADQRIFERRRSVPEEIIRKFNVTKDRTSESETNATMPEVTSPSSKEADEKQSYKNIQHVEKCERIRSHVFSQRIDGPDWPSNLSVGVPNKSFTVLAEEGVQYSAEEGSSDSDSDAPGLKRFNTIKRAPLRRDSVIDKSIDFQTKKDKDVENDPVRASQHDYYTNGRGVLKITAVEKSSQTGECRSDKEDSWTTVSAQEEESSSEGSSASISSPQLCTRALTSSDNISSDSEHVKCTCAELTSSKDTSTDPFNSGKSTLSQSVSDKSVSTQDSTISINSVSTRGSSISPASNSSSPEVDPRTSAKETTTSPDHTPRSPPGRGRPTGHSSRRSGGGDTGNSRQSNQNSRCPMHPKNGPKDKGGNGTAGSASRYHKTTNSNCQTIQETVETNYKELQPRTYEWDKWSTEELQVIQQQRNRKFAENNRQFITPLPETSYWSPTTESICTGTGSTYPKTEYLDCLPLMVPRYSALPRSMSMVVNTSSFDTNQYSDSDGHSLSDSLEDGQNSRTQIYFDTKNELKPVRGDVGQALGDKKKLKHKEPRGRAYFVSLDKDCDSDLVTNIYKIPEPPENIKNKIFERHTNICKTHRTTTKIKELSNASRESRATKGLKKKGRSKQSRDKAAASREERKLNVSKSIQVREEVDYSTNEINELTTHDKENAQNLCENDVDNNNVTSDIRKVDTTSRTNEAFSSQTHEITLSEESKSTAKPQAIIHPSQASESLNKSEASLDALQRHRLSLISSLESTATLLKSDQSNAAKQLNRTSAPIKRSSNLKFQQKFEVIPEERSSSLTSSAEDRRSEKDRRYSLPVKLTEPAISPTLLTEAECKTFRRYSLGSLSNYIIAKLMGKPLQAIPCVQRGPNNENHQIIIFSPKDDSVTNSAKGRDALLAMNREDFQRLSKGWMNFYLLKESSDNDSALEDVGVVDETNQFHPINETSSVLTEESKKIVCEISPADKGQTTSESGTDEHSTSPRYYQKMVDTKSYSLQLKESENGQQTSLVLVEKKEERTKNLNTTSTHDLKINEEKPMKCYEDTNNTKIEPPEISTFPKNISTSVQTYQQTSSNPKSEEELRLEKPQPPVINVNSQSEKTTREVATVTEPRRRIKNSSKEKLKLSENVKLHCSNTILRTTQQIISSSPRKAAPSSSRGLSLPEIPSRPAQASPRLKSRSVVETLPRIPITSGSDDLDSDSTVYMQAPSPEVPRLPLEGCCDPLTDDSVSSNSDKGASPNQRFVQQKRRGHPFRNRNLTHSLKPGWSVTLAGTVAYPRTTPDVQMRLSFPVGSEPPVVSQSDSGFVEEGANRIRGKHKQQWTVTVKNPHADGVKERVRTLNHLRTVISESSSRNGKKILSKYDVSKERIERKLSQIWPKVQEVIENEFNNFSFREKSDAEKAEMLSVRGKAVSLDAKPKPSTMSQREAVRNTATPRSTTLDR